jgi:hypothetical protein
MDDKLRNEIARKLYRMDTNLEDETSVRLRWMFMDKFIQCEVAVKKVMAAYKKEKKGAKDKDKGFLRLDMSTIPAALKWAGITFNRDDLDGLFSGSGEYSKRGTKSAKKLRDGVTHEHNENDIQKILDRFEELNWLMDQFLDIFRWNDAEKKKYQKKKKTEPALPL